MQVDYLAKTLFQPLLDGAAQSVQIKQEAEEDFVTSIDEKLNGTVFQAGCSNWYINAEGRNSASWPGYAAHFWYQTLFPRWRDFEFHGGSSFWGLRRGYRVLTDVLRSKLGFLCCLAACGVWFKDSDILPKARQLIEAGGF